MRRILPLFLMSFLILGLTACPAEEEAPEAPETDDGETPRPAAPVIGVDQENQVIRVGTLNDESGPAAAIGVPFAAGKRLLRDTVNAGGSDILPEGWRLELVERDHAYNPQRSVQLFNEIKDRVLFIGTSFGTPNTVPLRAHLERDQLVAFPASLSSLMAEHEYTPPIGTPYKLEAMRAMDFVVEQAGGTDGVRAGIIYQQDDYGQDGLAGWNEAATHHGVEVVSRQTVAPGQTDFTAAVSALREAGATHVLLSTLPSATGPILGTAAQLQFMPVWIGNTPSWIDRFFSPEVIPSAVFARFYWVMSLPYWGEDVPGMAEFLQAFEAHGGGAQPDIYILTSYIQGLLQMEIVSRMIGEGDLSRAAFKRHMRSIDGWTAGGLIQAVDLTAFPYQTSSRTRILQPNFEARSWTVASGLAAPAALGETAAAEDTAEGGVATE
jgi:ABC-type branched-subunit amino acid transport system substrate-binding protein